jgi:hypothetical protein
MLEGLSHGVGMRLVEHGSRARGKKGASEAEGRLAEILAALKWGSLFELLRLQGFDATQPRPWFSFAL